MHRTAAGDRVPGTFAEEAELLGLARVLGELNQGVFGLITDFDDEAGDLAWIRRIVGETGRPLWFTLIQKDYEPMQWRRLLDYATGATAAGDVISAQVAGRPVGLMLGFDSSLNPFVSRPSYREIADLSLEERVARLRDPAYRAPASGGTEDAPKRDHEGRHPELPEDVPAGRSAGLRARPGAERRH